MKTYTLNKTLVIRVAILISVMVFIVILTQFSISRRILRFITNDNLKHINEMGGIKAKYDKLWIEHRQQYDDTGTDKDEELTIARLKSERNMMSRQINEMWKVVAQLQCEMTGDLTSEDGGWCQSASTEDGGQHVIDHGLVRALSSLLKSMSVGSFGDGPGAYKREILKLGEVRTFDSYDGAPFCEETSSGRVQFLDLTLPQYNIPIYDFVLSLEVAEHIPSQYESTYLDNLCRHARIGIILSWAVPGQGGLSHVNNRPLSYVRDQMETLGFNLHETHSKNLQKASTFDWLKNNVFVYIRGDIKDIFGNRNKKSSNLFA